MEDEDVGKVFDDGRVVGRVDAKGARVKRVTEARRRAGPVHDALRKRKEAKAESAQMDGRRISVHVDGKTDQLTHPQIP